MKKIIIPLIILCLLSFVYAGNWSDNGDISIGNIAVSEGDDAVTDGLWTGQVGSNKCTYRGNTQATFTKNNMLNCTFDAGGNYVYNDSSTDSKVGGWCAWFSGNTTSIGASRCMIRGENQVEGHNYLWGIEGTTSITHFSYIIRGAGFVESAVPIKADGNYTRLCAVTNNTLTILYAYENFTEIARDTISDIYNVDRFKIDLDTNSDGQCLIDDLNFTYDQTNFTMIVLPPIPSHFPTNSSWNVTSNNTYFDSSENWNTGDVVYIDSNVVSVHFTSNKISNWSLTKWNFNHTSSLANESNTLLPSTESKTQDGTYFFDLDFNVGSFFRINLTPNYYTTTGLFVLPGDELYCVDGNFSIWCTCDSIECGLNLTFYKEDGAYHSVLEVKDFAGIENLTIPNTCWNYNETSLKFRMVSNSAHVFWYCQEGFNSFKLLRDGSHPVDIMYGMKLYQLFPNQTSPNILYASGIDTDGNESNASSSGPLRIHYGENIPPTWNNNMTNNTNPKLNDTVTFNVTWNDTINLSSYIFSWNMSNKTGFVNRSVVHFSGNQSNMTVTLNILNTTNINSFSWIIYANDTSNNDNKTGLFSVKISKINPTALNVNISDGENVDFNDSLNFTVVYYDSEGDTWIANHTKWYNNTVEIPNLENLTVISKSNTSVGDSWTVSVSVFDSFGQSVFVNDTVMILDILTNDISGVTCLNCLNNTGDDTSPYTSFNFTPKFNITTIYNDTCGISDVNGSYNNCESTGTTFHNCTLPKEILLDVGSNNVYLNCTDNYKKLNVDINLSILDFSASLCSDITTIYFQLPPNETTGFNVSADGQINRNCTANITNNDNTNSGALKVWLSKSSSNHSIYANDKCEREGAINLTVWRKTVNSSLISDDSTVLCFWMDFLRPTGIDFMPKIRVDILNIDDEVK